MSGRLHNLYFYDMQRLEDYNLNICNSNTNSEKFRIKLRLTLPNLNIVHQIGIILRMCPLMAYSQTTSMYAKILTFRRLLKTLQTIICLKRCI